MTELCPSRRQLLRGLAAVGVSTIGAGVLVACGSDSATTSGGGSDSGSSSGGGGTISASDVPVGEARVVSVGDRQVVVAQPSEGEFVAFSAACTHEGTTVTAPGGLELVCPAHGSRFDAADGSVEQGPAGSPLESLDVSVEGDQLVIA